MSKKKPVSIGKKIRQSHALASNSLRNFATHATTGQKIAAASTVGGALGGGIAGSVKAWRRKDKKNRLSRTLRKGAKGVFGGAVGGAITGHGVGRAVDYITNQRRESLENAIAHLVDYPRDIDDIINELAEGSKGKIIRRLIDPRKKLGSLAVGGVLGAAGAALSAKSAKEHSKDPKKFSTAKHVIKGAAGGAASSYAADVLHTSSKLAKSKLNRRWRNRKWFRK